MPTDHNPYRPPLETKLAPPVEAQPASSSDWAERLVEPLAKTQSWVLFLGILGCIVASLALVVQVGKGFMQMIAAGNPAKGGEAFGGMIFNVLFVMVWFAPSIYLIRYGNHIDFFRRSRKPSDLEAALRAQKSFFKFCGIFAIILLVIIVIGAITEALTGK